jgi:hypothetical protein
MTIESEALRFKVWAAERGILTYQPPEDDGGRANDPLDDLAETTQAAAVETILNHRKINMVLVSPERNEIVVCTH